MESQQQLDKIKDLFNKHFDKHLQQPKIYYCCSEVNGVSFTWDFFDKNGNLQFEIIWLVDLQTLSGSFDVRNYNESYWNEITNVHPIELSVEKPKDWQFVNTEIEWYSL